MIIRISKYLTLLAIASLFIRIGIWKPYTLQPYECFIIVSFILLCAHTIITKDSYFTTLLRRYFFPFAIVCATLIIGTVVALFFFQFSKESWGAVIKQFFSFFTVILGFLTALYHGQQVTFRKYALIAFCLPVLFSLFLPFLNLANSLNILGDGFVLTGFSGNSSILGFYLLIPLSIFSNSFLFEQNTSKKILFTVLFILTFSLILWTGSRGSWLASTALIAFQILRFTKKVSKIIIYSMGVVLVAIVSFLILPHPVKIMSLDRIFPQVTNYNPHPEVLKKTQLNLDTFSKKTTDATSPTPASIIPYQERGDLWPQALKSIIKYPLGLGPEYSRISNTIIGPSGNWILAHNTFLQAALSGGIILLIISFYFAYYILRQTVTISNKKERILYTSIWISFLLSIIFNDFLFSIPWVWIMAALIIASKANHK